MRSLSLRFLLLCWISGWLLLSTSCHGGGSGKGDSQKPQLFEVTNGHVTVVVDRRTGTFDIEIDGYAYVEGASSAVETGPGGLVSFDRRVHVPNESLERLLDVSTRESARGTVIELRYPQTRHGRITTFITLLADRGGLTAGMEFTVNDVENLLSLIPIYVGPETGGGLFMRSPPSDVQILQNGSEMGFDFYADLRYADYPFSLGFLKQYAANEPSSSSNWNALLYDRNNEEGLNMGYLSFESVIPEVIVGFDEERNPGAGGREGWFTFQTRNGYLIARGDAPGSVRTSELFWMDRFTGRPQRSLERYARMLADALDIRLTHEPVASWDSWYIYSDRIDQRIIEENLQGIVDHFLDYGMTSMQVDLGWESVWGNWTGDDSRFPCGMAYLAERIKNAGLTPELWVSPFNAMHWSDVLREHPDWAGEFHPLYLVLFQPGAVPLDLSRPEVVDFVAWTGEVVSGDFGFEAVKFDFAYYLQSLTGMYDPSLTVVEAYRRGVRAFRDALGWDKFFINILLNGINYGLCDSMRISIDSWACWGDVVGEECPNFDNTTGYDGSGIRIVLKALARRYYLNNVVWVNHPDQIFFRDYPGLIPQRSWATVVALSGAVMSLGEEIADMSAEEIETFRRLLPNLGITGVPWDLFDREYPEVWLTPLASKAPGGWVLHLYSWGNNWDRTVNPPAEIPEGTRHHTVRLSDLELDGPYHAFEFWTQTDLGIVDEVVEIEVPARDCRVVVLRPAQKRPYLVSSNRHVSQGGTDLHDPAWDPASGSLTWSQDLVLGFDHTVYVDPGPMSGSPSAFASGGALASSRAFGDLWAVDIVPATTGPSTVTLSFPLQSEVAGSGHDK